MARPRKSQALKNSHQSQEEIKNMLEAEEKLKGNNDKIYPPDYLSDEQCRLFNEIVDELESSGILTNLDNYILSNCSVAISRIRAIDKMVNENIARLNNKALMGARKDAEAAFFRCCNELCLSPQSRAKLAGLNAAKEDIEEDPLIKALLNK